MSFCTVTPFCLLYLLLTVSVLFHKIDACNSNGDTGGGETAAGGNGLNGLLGGDISDGPYDDSGATGDAIDDPSDLDCDDFEDCRWHNVGFEEDDEEWRLAEGEPDSGRLDTHTGEDTYTGSPSLVAFPDDGLDSEDRAFFVSDPILCQSGTGELSFSHYTTQNSELKVCQRYVGEIEPDSCTSVSGSGSSTVDIEPMDSPFEIFFYANGFETDEDFVMIDDIEYDATLCDGPINDETPAPTEPPLDDSAYCDLLQCNFNAGTPCSEAAGSNGPRGWQTVQGQCGNRNTGIRYDSTKNEQGSYACLSGAVTAEEAITFTEIELGEPKLLAFRWYKASYGAIFKVLVNGAEAFANDATQSTDREWREETVYLPAGRSEIAFVGDNLANYQYLGVDDLELRDESGNPFC